MNTSTLDYSTKIFIGIIGTVVAALVLMELRHIVIPLIIAYLLFFAFEPLNSKLKKIKVPRIAFVLIDLLIIILFIWGVSRIIIESFSEFGKMLPFYVQKLNNIISSSAISIGITDPFFTEFDIKAYLSSLDYGGFASGLFNSTISLVSGGFFVLFFFIFVSFGHERIYKVIQRRYIEMHKNDFNENPGKTVDVVRKEKYIADTFRDITIQIQNYLATKFVVSLAVGLIIALVLWIFGVEFLIVWAVIAFLLNFIPTIGSIIAVLLPSLMTLVQYESFGKMLVVALIIIGIQNIIGNIIEPKILGERLGLNPLIVLISLLIWGYMWGVVGMILSIPLTSILKIIMERSQSPTLHFISDLMDNN